MQHHDGGNRREAAAVREHAQVKRPAALDPPHGSGGDGRPHHLVEGCQHAPQRGDVEHLGVAGDEQEVHGIAGGLEGGEARTRRRAEAHAVQRPPVPWQRAQHDDGQQLRGLLDHARDRRADPLAQALGHAEEQERPRQRSFVKRRCHLRGG